MGSLLGSFWPSPTGLLSASVYCNKLKDIFMWPFNVSNSLLVYKGNVNTSLLYIPSFFISLKT